MLFKIVFFYCTINIVGSGSMKKVLSLLIIMLMVTSCKEKEYELYCENGELENNKCVVITEMEVKEKCRDGYTFNEENGKCENTIKIAAKQVSKCPKGYYIGSDYWCFSETLYEKEVRFNCQSPNIVDDDLFSSTYVTGDNKCIEKLCVTVSEDGSTCEEFKETEIPAAVEKSCPSGMKTDGSFCRKKYWMDRSYSCELGNLVGKECVIFDVIDMDLYCEDDSYKINEDGSKCEKVSYENPKEKEVD